MLAAITSNAWTVCQRYSRVASHIGTLGLDAAFFVGKMFPNTVPSIVPRASLFGLSVVSVIHLPYSFHQLKKVSLDTLSGISQGHFLDTLFSAFRISEQAANIGLISAGSLASFLGLIGQSDWQTALYTSLIPYGETSVLLGLAVTLASLYMNHTFLKKEWHGEDLKDLDSHIRVCMDKDTLADLEKKFTEENAEELLAIVRDNVKTQQNINFKGQIALLTLGYILMGVEQYYTANSEVAAAINLSMAFLWAGKVSFETLREYWQRERISALENQLIPV